VTVKLDEVRQTFNRAWAQTEARATLQAIDANVNYWRDEVSYVIKGRGLTRFEQYADLARAGRQRPLRLEQRQAVWQLYADYERGLRERDLLDFDDVILRAEASLIEHPLTGVDAVIIDEAQDLSCAMVRMLHSVVGNRPDGLTLIGDGQQTIYPGGWNLAEAGLSVTGRAVVLGTNYRNTRQIAEFAAQVVAGDVYADIEGAARGGDATALIPRIGPAPIVTTFASIAEHDAALLRHVDALLQSGVNPGDVGVLCRTNRDALAVVTSLRRAGHGVIELADYIGRTAPLIKVGTIKRAKGLEFAQVLLARVRESLMLPTVAGLSDGEVERREIDRREVYVGMTRARDGLWVGRV